MHVLTYKSKELNTEKVMEDLELLDFEDMSRFNDWRIRKETTINTYRRMSVAFFKVLNLIKFNFLFFIIKSLANYKNCAQILMAPNSYVDVPEYIWHGDELSKLTEILEEDPRFSEWQKSSAFGKLGNVYRDRNWL